MPYDKIDQLYDKLKKDGAVSKSREHFRGKILAPGKEGYQNRLQLYNALKADGAVDCPTYEEFRDRLELHAVKAGHPVSAAGKQQKTATPPSAVPAQSRPRKNQPLTLAQRQAMTGQARQVLDQTQDMIADTNERIKDMKRYGVGLGFGQTKEGGATYNPRTEKLERTYITPTGNRYSSKALADAESFHYRQEASKPLGLDMNAQQVAAAQKPADAAVAALWKEAEAKYAADRDKNAEKVYGGNPWLHAGREMHIVDAAINSHKNEMSRLTRFDLQKMMDNAWGRVGKRMTASCYAQLKKQYPTATEQQLRNSASAMARRLSDNAVYKYAVAKNTPKSTLEFFAKTAADTNLLRAISKGLARSEAGTTGDLAAYEQAMSDYGKNHRWAQIGGTVTGMMFDPTTYISGGVGSFASKTALNIGGRVVARKAATNVGARLFGKTLTGRVVAGMAGGAGNLGTYEGIKEGESQWLHGGHINPRTGGNGGYSAGDVLKSSLRGALLGSVTGTMSPLLGNVADKMVKATSSTAGKVGIRAGELVTSTVAEGTVFSIPEWIGGDGDAMDVWTDNMAMMMGFKGQRMIKSAPRVIAGLRPIENPRTARERNHNRMSFVERLRKQVDASPHDMAFSKEEREELRSHGYGDLATLFTRAPKQQPKPKAKPTSADGKAMYLDIPEAKVEDLGKRWLKQHPEFDGYDAMERLMKDPNVSQSARAKAYHVLTGRQLPMGSITGYVREQDGNGNIFVKSVTANGEVVTSRRFADEASAKKEQDKIMRQAELNSVDVGERYTEAKADNKVWEAAIEAVAPGADPETAKRNYQAAKEGDKDAIANYGQMVDAIDKFIEDNKTMEDTERPEAIRAAIKGETGVDVDEAIKKEPSKRAEPEKAAVQDYIERLFPEQKAENERPMSDDEAGASAIYDQSRLLWDKVEKGDADAKADVDAIALRMQEAYKECEDAFGTDAEMRMAEMDDNPWALVNDPELTDDQRDAALCYVNAKAAMEGVMDASNEAADGKRKEVEANVERHTHKDTGVVQPATMKVDDKPVYVVKGNVVMLPDGSGIDARNSDRSIVICDAETGEYKFASPDQLLSLGEAIDPQAEFDEAYANIQAEHEAVLGVPENADDVPTYAQNEVLTLLDERGNPVRAEIMAAANEDGLYEVLTDEPIDGKRVSMMSAEEIAAKSPFQEEPSGRMHDDTEDSFQGQEGGATHEAAETNDVKSALSRIPMDEKTKEPRYEEVDADTAWDAIVEQTNGDKALAQEVVDDTVNEMSSGIEKAEKSISKATFKGKGIQERIAFAKDKQERMAALVLEKERLAKWKRIASVERMRAAAVEAEKSKAAAAERKARQEEEEKARQAREETERKEREALNGVPNMTEDKPSDARARGYRRVDGHKVDRQAPVKAVMGKEVQVKFDDKNIPAGHVAIVDASELQPSHIGGQRNAKHFIDEAQPKERKDDASVEAARKIASNIRPEEITTSVTAYTGAPTVNSRGEVIQGNNRSAALKEMWASHPGQGARYKQYLKERAAEYGLTAEDIDKVQSPVLVNMLDVSDADAIALGQFVASDTESGGTERLKPKNVTKKLGGRMKTFSNILLRSSDEESSFSELLDRNGVETLKWLNGIGAITPTQYRSSFDSKGNLTAEAKNDLKGVLYQYVFEGGSTQLEEMFNGLPAKAQRAILSTAYRDYESAHDERMIEEIQDSIMAYHALSQDAQFMSATNHKDARAAVESWKRQYAIDDATGESYLPSEKFSNFALLLAVMYKGDTQSYIQAKFNAMYDLIQGVREDTLFGTPDNTPRTLAEAINEILNIDYDGRQRSDVLVGGSQVGQARGTGSPAGAERGERGTQGAEAAERGRRAKESANQRGVEDWNINTAGIFKTSYGKKNKEVYNRHTTVKQPVEAAETSQDAEQGDTQTSSSMNVPTSSESKATNNQSDLQGNGEKSSEKEGATPLSKKIESASEGVDTAPTEAQKEAGNYKKGHVQVGKFDITIEQPRGSIRKGTDANGKAWESKMHNTYGYIRGTVGVDGDHIDVFLSNDIDGWDGRKVYVVDQYNPDGSFDEHKVMLGFNDMDKAKSDYLANYEKGWEKGRRIDVSAMDLEDFEKWIASSKRKTKPFAKYAGLKKEDSQGNPLNADGTLKLERVKSVDDLTDDDFSNPTRSVELPSLPSKVDDAIGAKGKPVIIKKNILEKNYKSHPDLTPNQSREILESALYRPDLYGNNQKTKRPYNWVVINTTDEAGHNRLVLLEVNDNKDNVEIVHWHYIRDNALGTLKKQAEREGGLILILPSEQSEEAGGLSSRTPDLSSDGKDSKVLDTKQENLSEIEKQQGADELRNDTAAKQLATNAVLDALGNAGISVEVVSDEVASEMLGRNVAKAESANEEALGTAGRVQFMRMGGKKKSTPETASPDNQDQPTVVSSADGANILKSLDSEIKKYENVSSYPKTFIGDVSKALGATRQGSASEYASFETKSGKTVTIRLSNHNAKVSTFDAHDEAEGISIVVTPKENKGISNDGNAHVTEFYYNAIKLRRAEGKPLVEILKSIKQALYSGAYTDNTGLAEVKEVNVPTASDGQTDSGKVYGWTADGKIFLTKDGINPNTPIHEYTHLWAGAMRLRNEKGWQRVKNLLKGTPIWDEVLNDPNYRAISADEDAVASEALSRISGRENAKKMEAEAQRMIDEADGIAEKAEAVSLLDRMRRALDAFWRWIGKNLFGIKKFESIEEVTDRVLYDLTTGTDLQNDRSLMAVHNISVDKLESALELGGFPMPSIAITNANMGHAGYGDISLVFGKESVDPSDSRNKVYSGDAWTPTFPQIGYKLNDKKTNEIYKCANEVGSLPLFNPVHFHPDNYEGKIDRRGDASLVDRFKEDYGAKQMYLAEKGNAVRAFVQHEVQKYSPEKVSLYKKILETIGLERLKNDSLDSVKSDLTALGINGKSPKYYERIILCAIDYAEHGNSKIENDIDATEQEIDKRIDGKSFSSWLENLFNGVVEKKGIRNERDRFTPSGNSRKWESLYDAVTLDNVIKSMQRQAKKGGEGFFNSSIFGASTKELPSIDAVRREAKLRINTIPDEKMEKAKGRIIERLEKVRIPSVEKGVADAFDFVDNVISAVSASHSPSGIYKYLHAYYPDMTMDAAKEISDIVGEIQKMSAKYFEAKPYRAVGFDEVRAAVVPNDVPREIIDGLRKRGVKVVSYEKGNEQERKDALSSVTHEMDIRFQIKGKDEVDAENGERHREDVEEVNEQYNSELAGLTEENADTKIFNLGRPSSILLSAGVEDKPMKLYGNKVVKKMKKHGFALDELRNLPKAVADPIAVFDNIGRIGNRSILTELRTQKGNFLVTIDLGKGGDDVDFNIVSSVFGKDGGNVVDWIERGLATYINKEKAFRYLHHSALSAEALSSSRLSSAAKIVKDFVNPSTAGEESVLHSYTEQRDELDKRYMAAVKRGDMATAQRMVNEAARRSGYFPGSNYQGTSAFNGSAPYGNGYFITPEERKEAFENDEFDGDTTLADYVTGGIDPMNLDFLLSENNYRHSDAARKEAIDNIREVVRTKGQRVTMYRSVPSSVKEGSFRNGDWVTPSRKYAEENARVHGWGSEYRIIAQDVPISDVWFDGNDIAEWGYGSEADFLNDKDYLYGNTRNNRKLPDAVTYDDNGDVIPLSKRFDTMNGDLRFRTDNGVEEVNERFNRELQLQIDGRLPNGHVYALGMPSDILLSTGVPDLPIQMNASRLKAKATSFGHDFELNEIKDLVKALQTPLAVFAYGDKSKAQNIIVPFQKDGKNFIVGLSLNPTLDGRSLEINSVRNVFPKNNSEWLNWISQGKALYLDKEKVQTLIDQQRTILADVEYLNLNSIAKIVENFENPNVSDGNVLRERHGSNGDEDISLSHDPMGKLLGESAYTDAQRKAFVERERKRMAEHVSELSKKLNLDNVDVVTDASALSGKRGRAKGFFNKKTGRIAIVIPNHTDMADVEKTLLHEAVAHHGLRKLFGENFDNFLDNVYRNAEYDIRKRIAGMASNHGWDVRTATEEYLAGLAEDTNFENMPDGFWSKIKRFFLRMLHSLGFKNLTDVAMGDNELRYVLWRSYENLKEPGRYRNFFAEAADVAKQHQLKVGAYEVDARKDMNDVQGAAESDVEENARDNKAGKADTEVARRKTGFGDTKFSDGYKKSAQPNEAALKHLEPTDVEHAAKIRQKRKKAKEALLNVTETYKITTDSKGFISDLSNSLGLTRGKTGSGYGSFETSDGKLFTIRVSNHNINAANVGDEPVESIVIKTKRSPNRFHAEEEKFANEYVYFKEDIRKAPAGTLSSIAESISELLDTGEYHDKTGLARENHSPETDPDGGIMFRNGDMGLEKNIAKMKAEASRANADNWQAKQDAMRAIGGNLNKLRQAMARQREYDLSTVKSITDLAKVLLENGMLDDLSKYETKRILSAVNNVHGKQDASDYVQKVMDIMVDNQLRMGANQLGKLLSIRGSRIDARGVEVQGQLDPEGQRIAWVVRKASSLPKENIEERIADCANRMSSDADAVAEEAAIEYSGLSLAHRFVEDITESKAEEKALRESVKEAKADLDAGTMEADAYHEYVESTNDAIRQNKIERAEAYHSMVEQVGGVLGGSVERAKAWREAEKRRVKAIHHNANSDMTGRPNDEHRKESKAQKIANNSIVRFVLAPLGTFDQMLRMFGKKSVNGEGYLWNRYMRGWVEATEKEYTGYQNALKTLDEKVGEVFGKKMKWGDLFSLERKLPKATVTFWDGGEQKVHELTQGNLLYIYMVDKMADGRMKLRRMGIIEEDLEKIKDFVDPRFLELADWMQDEFLVEKRNEYNEVHKRMFGASMAAIENYFPLKILANARIEEVDVADDTTDTALPATSTGSIIKRRRNNLALDVMGADAFSVILDHIQQMERWASFAEFNRDLNTLLSYKRFRNQVMNMTSVYGGGKTLWKNFRNVCSMAAGAYRPPIAALDKAAVNVAKGVTAAKVSLRVFTALKQLLSMPAYLSDSSPVYLAGNVANPIGAWKWSMENLPLFEKRWKSRVAGDPRLMKSEMDWKTWRNRAVEIASRIGMSPNAFVDALTVAIGARSMYQTKKKKYLRYGYDEETAKKRAKQDATILFNQTQQSSESAFLSTMQADRSWLSVLFTVFRNSSMSYTRQLYDALRNLKHRFEPGYKGLTEEYLAKQMRRDGIDPDKADRNAKSEYRRSLMRDIVRVGVFGYLLQLAWNLGAYLPYLLLGDDKDEKSDMWHDIFCHTMFGSIEGLTGGDVMSAVGNGFAKGEGLNLFYASKDMPLSSDLQNIVSKWDKDKVAAMNDVTNLMVQSGIGVNPQSLTDAVVAIMDCCGDDANTSRECALLITRVINCPQSQIDKIYFDELDATAAEAQGMTPAEIAERYARYKVRRGAPLTGWAYADETRDSVMTARQNRALAKAKEKLNGRMETEETKQLLSDYDAIAKQETALSKIKKTDREAYRKGMKQLRLSNDMRQHLRLKRYKHDMKELTSKYLRCKCAEELDSIVSTMFSTRAKMLEDIGRLKQQ